MSKPNYGDIARHAGVGTATVERVLNGRGGVRPDLVAKVVIAARSLRVGIRPQVAVGGQGGCRLPRSNNLDRGIPLRRCEEDGFHDGLVLICTGMHGDTVLPREPR